MRRAQFSDDKYNKRSAEPAVQRLTIESKLYSLLQELSGRMAIVMVSHDIGTITSVVREIVCVNRSVHRHRSNRITPEQLLNYNCPIQIITHGDVPHTVLEHHPGDGCCEH